MSAKTTLAILAGGAGSRMGRPKGNLTLRGEPILARLLRRLNWPGPSLLVTAPGRENPRAWEQFDREVTDPVAGLGPMRGILTALEHVATVNVVVLTVDMPEISTEQLQQLGKEQDLLGATHGVFFSRCVGDRKQIEPFPCLFNRSATTIVARYLAEGRGVFRLAQELGFATVEAPSQWPENVWTNLNDSADLDRYCSMLATPGVGDEVI